MYMDKSPDEYQRFAKQVLAIARRLNAPASSVQQPAQLQAQNHGQRRQRAVLAARQN